MADRERHPAFYAADPGGWRDWWTLLHPPYTVWHLSYVAVGAAIAPHFSVARLVATLIAFLAATGVAAHALDELHGHPLGTDIPDIALVVTTVIGLTVALAIGIVGVSVVGVALIPFIVIGPILVVGYNLELFGGHVHTDIGFALAWGAFPVLTGFVAQAGDLDVAALLAATAAAGLSSAQRALSTPARQLRRRVHRVDGTVTYRDGTVERLDADVLLKPIERALRALSWSMVVLATALVLARLL